MNKEIRNYLPLLVIVMFVLLIWGYNTVWLEIIFPKADKTQLENLFSPFNALFSALAFVGLVFTIVQQHKALELQREELKATREELHTTAEANQTIVSDNKVTAFIQLYLFYYDSNNFGKARSRAWKVISNMIKHEEYYKYVFSRQVMAARGYIPISDEHRQKFQKIYSTEELSLEQFHEIDNLHRHNLEDFLNFINLLSIRGISKDFFQKVDFYYDTWRQILWWYALKIESEYKLDIELQNLCSDISLVESLKSLDNIMRFTSPNNIEETLKYPVVLNFLNPKRESSKNTEGE